MLSSDCKDPYDRMRARALACLPKEWKDATGKPMPSTDIMLSAVLNSVSDEIDAIHKMVKYLQAEMKQQGKEDNGKH